MYCYTVHFHSIDNYYCQFLHLRQTPRSVFQDGSELVASKKHIDLTYCKPAANVN
jgi:hypothetical protein